MGSRGTFPCFVYGTVKISPSSIRMQFSQFASRGGGSLLCRQAYGLFFVSMGYGFAGRLSCLVSFSFSFMEQLTFNSPIQLSLLDTCYKVADLCFLADLSFMDSFVGRFLILVAFHFVLFFFLVQFQRMLPFSEDLLFRKTFVIFAGSFSQNLIQNDDARKSCVNPQTRLDTSADTLLMMSGWLDDLS